MFRLRNTDTREGFVVDMSEADAEVDPAYVDQELIREVSCRHILHWNYRSFTTLPTELLGRLLV